MEGGTGTYLVYHPSPPPTTATTSVTEQSILLIDSTSISLPVIVHLCRKVWHANAKEQRHPDLPLCQPLPLFQSLARAPAFLCLHRLKCGSSPPFETVEVFRKGRTPRGEVVSFDAEHNEVVELVKVVDDTQEVAG